MFQSDMILHIFTLVTSSSLIHCRPSSDNLAFKRPTVQSNTYKNHKSDLAVDGNIETWSVAGDPDNIVVPDRLSSNTAWWSVKLDSIYYIKSISLDQDHKSPFAEYLNTIIIYVSINSREYLTCTTAERISDSLNLTCNEELYGNTIHIAKHGGNRLDIIALCEVIIFGELYTVEQNVALKKKASQSGTYSMQGAHLAIDGKAETCSFAKAPANQSTLTWWQVDLNGIFNIKEVTISYYPKRSSIGFLHGFIIFVSINAEYFEQQICSTFDEAKHYFNESLFQTSCRKAVYGQFVTIVRSQPFESVLLGLCEVKVRADLNTDIITLPYRRITTQSSVFFEATSGFSVDGNVDTCTVVVDRGIRKAWWRVTLDNIYSIANISILFNPKRNGNQYKNLNNFNVYVSNDEEDYRQQLCTSFTEGEGDIILTCDHTVAGRFITFENHDGPDQTKMYFCEVLIYAKEVDKNCTNGSISCDSICVAKEKICDRIKHCQDGSDEKHCTCLPHQYKCDQGLCIHNHWLCDGSKDCPLGDDEMHPTCSPCALDQYKCYKNNECIDIRKKCDGTFDCLDSSDETLCLRVLNGTNNFLVATFKGLPNHHICSTYWTSGHSFYACIHMGSKIHVKTAFMDLEVHEFVHVKDDALYNYKVPFMAMLEKKERCPSNKFVKLTCSTASVNACGVRGIADDKLGPYIINGDDAKLGAWPWHAQLIVSRFNRCGGSIIASKWILTAAHCLQDLLNASEISVKVGTILENDPMVESYQVESFAIHPNHSNERNDIALVKLRKAIFFNNVTRPICLPDMNADKVRLNSHRYCVMSGLGYQDSDFTNPLSKMPRRLQQGRMNLMTTKECLANLVNMRREWKSYLQQDLQEKNNKFCAGSLPTSYGVNACRGDGGSPLVCRNEHGIWTQIGIAIQFKSHVFLDLKQCLSTIMLRVESYMNFINHHTDD